MRKEQAKINKILTNFLKSEANVTDERIISIRNFLAILQEATDKYLEDNHSKEEREELSTLLESMSETYRQEVSHLLVKRGKLAEFVSVLQTPTNKEPIPNTINIGSYVN